MEKKENYYFKETLEGGEVKKNTIHTLKCKEIDLVEDDEREDGRLIGHIGHYNNPDMAYNDLKKYKENVGFCNNCLPFKIPSRE